MFKKKGFSDAPKTVLRRVSGLPSVPSHSLIETGADPIAEPPVEVRPWKGKGVELPHGTKIWMEYYGIRHEGRIENGYWFEKGARVASPLTASSVVTQSTYRNGKKDWQVKRPGYFEFW
ncbi:MAG: hypothetical protein OXC63_14200 [Aestuariivita sp.]|nr:hypothetical protein [Aestuariivita sp.]MCY4345172.1 hypothetical protein [Aestuariivita sp.]